MSVYIGWTVDESGTERVFKYPFHKYDATAAPGATNDTTEGYEEGSVWIDVTNDAAYTCVDNTEDAAVWVEQGASASGDVSGPGSSTDTAIALWDGTDGDTLQDSSITVDGSSNMSGIAALGATTIELGHASDTTLARSSAGNMSIEGNVVYRAGGTDVPVADGGTGSSTASGARTNLGATTVGGNFFTLSNPGAITFPRINADNTVTALSDSSFRTAIGSTTVGDALFTHTNPSAISFIRVNADNSVDTLDASSFLSAIGGGAGTVTSVGLSLPSIITVSGSPVTGSGTLTGTLANQDANKFFAGPTSGAASTPAFRILVEADFPAVIANPNILPNGSLENWQRGTSFTSSTPFVNNDAVYTADNCILLSDGNDVVSIAKETTTVPSKARAALKATVVTANKKFGFLFPLSHAKSLPVNIANGLSAAHKARRGASATLGTYRWAILSWTGTADSITRDVVSAWNTAGTDPTLVANWDYDTVPAGITLTNDYVSATLANVTPTSGETNRAVFIWTDDTSTTVGDILYIAEVKVERGTRCTDFIYRDPSEERSICQARLNVFGGATAQRYLQGRADATNTGNIGSGFPTEMEGTPTVTLVGSNLQVNDRSVNVTVSSIASSFSSSRAMTLNVTTSASTLTVDRSLFFDFGDTVSFLVCSNEL